MNLSVSDELHLFSQELQRHMSPHALEQLAKEIGFVQRKSKYRAQDLVSLCVWLSQKVANTSLSQLCSCLEASTGVFMSTEGLNQRFNSSAVQLLQQVLARLLHQRLRSSGVISGQCTKYFHRIRVMDSTMFQLPDSFASMYQGSGGSSNKAGIKIQLEYDILSGQFLNIHTGPGKENDKTYGSQCLTSLQSGDVCIRDLGYFSLEDFNEINQRGAYFLSRLKLNMRIYQKNEHPEYFQNGTIKKHSEYIQLDLEQLQCHIYGQLISILLCSSTMFQMRQLLLRKKKKS